MSQTRFLSAAPHVLPTLATDTNNNEEKIWDIPLTITFEKNGQAVIDRVGIWAASKERKMPSRDEPTPWINHPLTNQRTVTAPATFVRERFPHVTSAWVKMNVQQQGYYMDNYCSDGWQRLQAPCRGTLGLTIIP